MDIVVLDAATLDPGDNPWDEVAALGRLTVYDRTPEELIAARARGAEVVLTNKTPLTAATLARLDTLRYIAVLATGYNVVDIDAARRRGIAVSNVPEYGTDSVAQHVVALLLELCHGVGRHAHSVREGEWGRAADFCFWHAPVLELSGLTLGLVGFGRIGRRVASICGALGMNVVAYTPSMHGKPAPEGVGWCELDELFRSADVVSLHCPLTVDNEGLVDADRLRTMKPSALLVNTARGALVDEAALAAALSAGRIAGAAVDVAAREPMHEGNPLRTAPRCIVTPHMAWSSLPARRRLMAATAANVRAYQAGSPVNVVNPKGTHCVHLPRA